ncbi:MAG: hypothetical protein A2V86_08735 [Deltaproteobacteria bacterium RBG_16_49_23]|nr:MAG: hypothetical protein A2V86_08735 [Deltaproteobacteria bacterium RBG_16_49_23]
MRKTLKAVVITLFFFFIPLLSTLVFALDIIPYEVYDAPGLHPYRETLSSIPNEHIDPFMGGLTLTFEDIRLPGNGGLDLVIQRTFNSKNVCNVWAKFGTNPWYCQSPDENTWLGYGWTLHFGKLFKSNNINVPHVIEMPDSSRFPAYNSLSNPSKYITKEYWILDTNTTPYVLTLTNGMKIHYGQSGPPHPDYPNHFANYATLIQDVHGNQISIYYKSFGSSEIDYVIDSTGRTIDFVTSIINGATRLISITGSGVSISYTHASSPTQGRTFLTQANLPVGNPWRYQYNQNNTFDLEQVTTPSGGVITYTYGDSAIDRGQGWTPYAIWGVVQKTTSGTIPAGTWSIAYSAGTNHDYTEIADPCGRSHRYKYHGYGEHLVDGSMWKIGLPKSREIVGEETVSYGWTNAPAISNDDYNVPLVGSDLFIYVPLMTQNSITRDGRTYTTNFSNFDAYGNPQTISASGDTTRNRSITYWYNTSMNIVKDKPAAETVSGGFPGSFSTTYTYDTNTGNLTQLNKYGVITTFTYWDQYAGPTKKGNLRTRTDHNGHTNSYDWDKGRISTITNPIYSISRVINNNGTIASETNGRGYVTSFTYDGNLRLTSIAPPGVNPTTFTYPADNSYKLETRGGYWIYHYNDGLGRPTGATDSKDIDTDIFYKTCGPKNYSTSNIGDTIYFDNFNRITQITHKDSSRIAYQYSQSNVVMNDESLRNTTFTHNAFGNPDEKLLVGVTDPLGSASYNYNILGSLIGITQGSITRAFNYNSKNFLEFEAHPEKGAISYGRDNIGNMAWKSDSLGTTTYGYDALDRLTTINYGTGTVTFGYDNANNRTSMTNPSATITYEYDPANRLTRKTETIIGRTYYTDYRYDGNDNLTDIYYPPLGYPSGRRVQYMYNSNNQVTSIPGKVTSVSYCTSGTCIGLPSGITHANGITASLAYNNGNFVTQINAGAALNVGYGYADSRGNMTSITNYLDSSKNQTFDYDELSRLRAFNGPWGTGSFTYYTNGNRWTKTVAGVATTYNYDSTNRLTSTTGGEPFSFAYNNDGDTTGMNGYTLEYDRLHNLTNYKLGGNPVATYAYDGESMRLTKTVGTKNTFYHYDREGRVLSEDDGNGNFIAQYIYLHGKLVAKVMNDAFIPPATPASLTGAALNATQVTLNWVDNSDNEQGFKIERKTGIGGTYAEIQTVGPNVTSYTDSGLTPGVTYYYRVRAYNWGGESSYTSETSVTPNPKLTVAKAGGGTGTVTSSPAGINCGGDCTEIYSLGTVVTLTPSSNANSYFAGWSGSGCSGTGNCVITMNADKTVTATFQIIPPTAGFSGSPLTGSAPLTVNFTDLSTYNPTSWTWNFGDGATSTLRNPSHTYRSPGVYTVSLTASNAGGSDIEMKTNYINVAACANLPVKVGTQYFSSLQAAYNTASPGAIIRTQGIIFTENLNIYRDISVTIEGGYNCSYSAYTADTILKGMLSVSAGTANIRSFTLEQ